MQLPSTRKAARDLGLKIFLGNPCSRGHSGIRYVRNNACKECDRARLVAWRQINPHKARESAAQYKVRHPELVRQRQKRWRLANPDKRRAQHARNYARHRASKIAAARARESAQLQAVPPWLTDAQRTEILAVYAQARFFERMTGLKFHVDHIQPLRGKDRSGLHVPWNLRCVTSTVNWRKGNRVPDPVE